MPLNPVKPYAYLPKLFRRCHARYQHTSCNKKRYTLGLHTGTRVYDVFGLLAVLEAHIDSQLDSYRETFLAIVQVQQTVLRRNRSGKPCIVEHKSHVEKACLAVYNKRRNTIYLVFLKSQEIPVITCWNRRFCRKKEEFNTHIIVRNVTLLMKTQSVRAYCWLLLCCFCCFRLHALHAYVNNNNHHHHLYQILQQWLFRTKLQNIKTNVFNTKSSYVQS